MFSLRALWIFSRQSVCWKEINPSSEPRSWILSSFMWMHGKAIYTEAESECVNSCWGPVSHAFGLNLILHLERQAENALLIRRISTNTTDNILTAASHSFLLGRSTHFSLGTHEMPGNADPFKCLVLLKGLFSSQGGRCHPRPHFRDDVRLTKVRKFVQRHS